MADSQTISSNARPTRAFVAGATGFVGRQVVAVLRARGIDTLAHVRPDSKDLASWQARFAELGATVAVLPWEPEALSAAMRTQQPTCVFSLLGTTRKRARREQLAGDPYQTIDVALTRMLIGATVAAALTPPPRIVLLSSLGAESGRGAYLRARVAMEAAVVESGLPHSIVRPSFITGVDASGHGRDEARPGEAIGAAVSTALLGVVGMVAPRLRLRYAPIRPHILAAHLVDEAMASEPHRVVEAEALARTST